MTTELQQLTKRVETLSGDVLAMKATWSDSLGLARQMQATAETLVLQLVRLVETLAGASEGLT